MKLKKVQIIYVDRINPNKRICVEVTVEDKGDKTSNCRTAAQQFREKMRKLCNYPETKIVYVG